MECAAAIGVDAKYWIDNIEDNIELDADSGSAVADAIRALAHEKADEVPTNKPTAKAPDGSLAVEALGRIDT